MTYYRLLPQSAIILFWLNSNLQRDIQRLEFEHSFFNSWIRSKQVFVEINLNIESTTRVQPN